MKCFLRDHN